MLRPRSPHPSVHIPKRALVAARVLAAAWRLALLSCCAAAALPVPAANAASVRDFLKTRSTAATQPPGVLDPALLAGLKARSIGPAGMSGRVAVIEAVESNRDIVYVGAATGGVWKSTNGGLTWKPIFDDQPVAAVGAVAVFQPNPDIVWVGTGEANPRNSASVGNGVYRSLDAGETWTHLGLDDTERIARILTHPTRPEVAYVAAMGKMWGENEERGVYKTEDGGKTWTRSLYVDVRTGCADLAVDPANPDHLIAAMWDYRRWPWFFRSGGPGSGLYSTWDGGITWKRATEEDGLPKGDLGRIGVAFCRNVPSTVYAIVEAEKSALLRSDDGGRAWRTVNSETNVSGRPFYYSDLRVDPERPDRVYQLSSLARVSEDGGKSWRVLIGWNALHPDHHAMWIDPQDPEFIWNGNDGGVGVSQDRGATWRFVGNLPLAQYYHIAVDNLTPYNVYGGMQDNGSWRGPNAVWENGGIRNHHWEEVGFGDGFDTRPDPADPLRGYSMSQEGYLMRWDVRTGERKSIRPAAPNDSTDLRFNWNTGLAVDPFDAGTIYLGSQFVHKSPDRGETWTIISPDLTTNNPEWQKQRETGGITPDVTGAENFTTIITIAPSPLERGLIWVGTDDGRVQVTRDGGGSWASVEGNAGGVPRNSWVPHICPSKFDAAVAYVVFDDHRRSNWAPYVFKVSDYGRRWQSLATDDLVGYCLTIEQDPVKRDLLFLGTEFGLFVSTNDGASWMRWKHGVPTVSVMDLMVHPREHDLVIATHGRAAYILDDIRPLRTVTAEILAKPLHLFDIPPAQQYVVKQTGGSRFPGAGEFRGENRPYGAMITWSMSGEGLPHPDDKIERERKEQKRIDERNERRRLEGTPVPDQPETPMVNKPRAERDTKLKQQGRAKEREQSVATREAATKAGEPGAASEAAEAGGEEPGAGGRGGPGRQRDKGPQVDIRITDAAGHLVRKLKAPAKLGVNRFVWDLSSEPFKEPPRERQGWEGNEGGPEVTPGTYTVTIKFKDDEVKGTVQVLADPRLTSTTASRQANWDAQQRAGKLQEVVAEAVQRIKDTAADADVLAKKVNTALAKEKEEREKAGLPEAKADSAEEAADPRRAFVKRVGELKKGLTALEKRFWIPPDTKGIAYEDQPLSRVQTAQWFLGSSWDQPTPATLAYLGRAERELQQVLVDFNKFFAEDVAAFRKEIDALQLRLLPELQPLAVPGAP